MADGRTYFSAVAQLAVGDVTLTIVAAPTAGAGGDNYHPGLRIHRIVYHPNTSTAATMGIDVGAQPLMIIPTRAFLRRDTGWMPGGIDCPNETALICTPSGAGNAGDFFVTYSVEG